MTKRFIMCITIIWFYEENTIKMHYIRIYIYIYIIQSVISIKTLSLSLSLGNFITSSVCKCCNVPDTVFHIFSNCYRIITLLDLLENIFKGFGWNFSKIMLIFGCKYHKSQSEHCTFSNFLIGQAKLTIWKAYTIENEGKIIRIVELFKALVESRV